MHRTRTTLGLLLFVLLAPASGRAGEATKPGDVYVRNVRNIEHAYRILEVEAERIEARQVLVAFDLASFSPPPGRTEFSYEYLFSGDLWTWIEGLEQWAEESPERSFRATSSLNLSSVKVGKPGWDTRLRAMVTRRWFEDRDVPKFEPAEGWIRRLLQRTELRGGKGGNTQKRMLVLVTGGMTPERWVFHGLREGFEFEWRRKLLPVGDYWKEEAIGSLLQTAGCPLFVVAPEARFGDIAPIPELPQAPWAARPQHPDPRRSSLVPRAPPTAPGGLRGGRRPAVPGTSSLREQLENDPGLKALYPDPKERQRVIEEILKASGSGDAGGPGGSIRPAPPLTPPPGLKPLPSPSVVRSAQGGRRYQSTTPMWFEMFGGAVLFNNDAPSGYGAWHLARTAARSGGRYLFYPFPPTEWLDKCPYDGAQLTRMMPELVSRSSYLAARDGDGALDAMCKAARLVVDDTPWADTMPDDRVSSGWSGFARARPLRKQRDWDLRRKPYDYAIWGTEHGLPRMGERLLEKVLPRYDEALRLMDDALERWETGEDRRSHARSVANLRILRYWFSMSAFHLHALALYAQELDRFIPPEIRGNTDWVTITYVPAIRMSDCLKAYFDDRRLSIEDEAKYGPLYGAGYVGYQGNILNIPEENADYRAQRNLGSVLKNLDKRLSGRALRMVRDARDVMEHHALSPWGWTTYYSEAYTFIFTPVQARLRKGHRPAPSGKKVKPKTPSSSGTPGTGSGSGGPSTGK